MQIDFKANEVTYTPIFQHAAYFLEYPCGDEKNECYPIEAILPKGVYLLEVWGAAGGLAGPDSVNEQSRGGYSKGILTLSKNTKAYFYLGAAGTFVSGINATTRMSFNGGGFGRNGHEGKLSASGGGGTDVRLISNDLYHRVIVAGGGGGSSQLFKCTPGHGGGESGFSPVCDTGGSVPGNGGAQTGLNEQFGKGTGLTTWDGMAEHMEETLKHQAVVDLALFTRLQMLKLR